MAKINFTKGEKFYTAEFQINGPTAIHIERNKVGPLYLKQKSVENGQYDFVKDFGYNRGGDLTIDTAIQGVVYPMWIKIESASEPTLAEMVEGEQSGGGAGAESGDWHYFDVSALDDSSKKSVIQTGMLHKVQGEKIESLLGTGLITTTGFGYMIPIDTTEIKAVATDFATKIQLGEQIVTIEQSITTAPWYGQVPEITKEQFYSLEA